MSKYLLMVVPRKPLLVVSQFQALVDMSVGAGLVSLGSILIPALFDKGTSLSVIYGVTGVIVFWSMAIWFAGKTS